MSLADGRLPCGRAARLGSRGSASSAAVLLASALGLAPQAAAQVLSGGGFEMESHGIGPVAMGSFTVTGVTRQFAGRSRAFAALQYPLAESGGKTLTPTPGGELKFETSQNNVVAQQGLTVSVPAGAVPVDYDFFVNTNPTQFPTRVSPNAITQANARAGLTVGPQAAVVPNSVVEFNLLQTSGGFYDGTLARPAMISLPYTDADNNGLVDGTMIRVRTLNMYVLDEPRALWVRVPSSALDAAAKTVSAPTPHFSVYTLIGVADTVVDNVHPFPVPWAPNSGDPLNGTLAGGITFDSLPTEGTISIYTLAGQLVRSLQIPPGLFPAQLRWDGKTSGGRDVVSGIYLWRIQSGGNSKTDKLIIIR